MFPLSSSLLSSYDADTEGEPIVCIFSQSTGQKSSHFISVFESKAVLSAGKSRLTRISVCVCFSTTIYIYIYIVVLNLNTKKSRRSCTAQNSTDGFVKVK